MTHTAKKIHAGRYEYRGWLIEDMKPYGATLPCWNMTPAGEPDATDSENTLAQCKAFIDLCENKKEA